MAHTAYIALLVIARPLTALVLFVTAACIARYLRPRLPNNRFVEFLYKDRMDPTVGLSKPLPKGLRWIDKLVRHD